MRIKENIAIMVGVRSWKVWRMMNDIFPSTTSIQFAPFPVKEIRHLKLIRREVDICARYVIADARAGRA